MTAVTGAIETLVARQVKTAVKQQHDELQAQVPSRPVVVDPSIIAATVVSDDIVRRLVQKIHTLAQEERFRSGLLR